MDELYTEITLDKSTNLNFRTNAGKILSRSVTYCHDVPGIVAFKKIVVNVDESKDVINVVGVDDGKRILEIGWNWSMMGNTDEGKEKLMGPKRTIILAAVSNVKENYHNMMVLMELINMNEIEYSLSMDLKLTNITI